MKLSQIVMRQAMIMISLTSVPLYPMIKHTVPLHLQTQGTLPDIKIPKEFRQICTKDFYYPDDINILSMAFYTTKPGHFGLGLFIANIVCLNHDGCLDVTHDDAHTSFHLSFAI